MSPRSVRNFWVNVSVDGKAEDLASGPVGKEGGFEQNVWIRQDGEVAIGLSIRGYSQNGENVLSVFDHNGNIVHQMRVAR